VSRIRWRLARLVAPAPIMRDPLDGQEGVFFMGRSEGHVWTMRANRFRLKSSRRLQVREYRPGAPFDYQPSESFVRFVGTVAR
jgi:hypothetical protein